MSAPIPTPSALAQRFVTALAAQSFVATDGTVVTLDATAPATLENALAVLSGLSDYEVYLALRDQLLELMPTTATVTPGSGLLPDHAIMWDTPRLGATAATGTIVVTASQAVTVLAGSLVTADGTVQWAVNTGISIAAGSSVSVAVTCVTAGTIGNLAPNATLNFVTPILGITNVVADQSGFTGGAEIEAVESWRSRIIASVRNPPGAGNTADYQRWARAAGAAYVGVQPGWYGPGTVGIFVAASGGAVLSSAQVAQIQSAIDAARPVQGSVTVMAAEIVPQNLTITLNPDTQALRSAVTAALQPYCLSVGIGGRLYLSALESAVVQVAGVQTDISQPNSDVQFAANQMPVLGTITWGTT
ncbi:baseplate J/gp47 family protein [Neokomagataea anthophila]|uniref:Baseplate J/gp47 family protein n=1 Tax=Neokomagataea anthophila TaxID=2826925 RepID=A0ABS5E6F2_9PROT|nr:baseplate J/gp47 family protein [Neokomagataea anthophila]MBR0559490.1 baseplate J/gp47 family protein [Neokomagataea anthophila]